MRMKPRRLPSPAPARPSGSAAGLLALALVVVVEGGCAAPMGAGAVAPTRTTPLDHVYSAATGKTCAIGRVTQGLTYCVEDEVTPAGVVHCYSSLGQPTCYDRRDPFPGGQRELASHGMSAPPAVAPPPAPPASAGPTAPAAMR